MLHISPRNEGFEENALLRSTFIGKPTPKSSHFTRPNFTLDHLKEPLDRAARGGAHVEGRGPEGMTCIVGGKH